MVLCVGSFFGGAGDDGDAAVWKALLAGERRVPMPVYLLGPNSQERKMTECTIFPPQCTMRPKSMWFHIPTLCHLALP